MKRSDFENLVTAAIEGLPQIFRESIKNVAVIVEDEPTPEQNRKAARRPSGAMLLGLYEGVPLSGRTSGYSGAMPDKITIFEKNIERICKTDEEIKREVIHVVGHELAHHFGISDRRLRKLGIY